MATVLALANQKGGVAKTTSTFNIAAGLAQRGFKVLMLDMDPQASLTIYAGLEPYDQPLSIADVLKKPRLDPRKAITSLRKNLDIIPSCIEMASVENEILARPSRELILSRALQSLRDLYDFICIDCPPQLSTLTINALSAADKVIIPCKTDYLAYRGLKFLLESIETVKAYFNPGIEVVGILATLFESRANDDKEILEVLQEEYNVIGIIKRTTQAKKGMYDGLSSVEYSPKSELAMEYERIIDILV